MKHIKVVKTKSQHPSPIIAEAYMNSSNSTRYAEVSNTEQHFSSIYNEEEMNKVLKEIKIPTAARFVACLTLIRGCVC